MNKKNKKISGKKSNRNTKAKKKKSVFTPYESKILAFLKRDKETQFGSRELMRRTNLKDKEQFYNALRNLTQNDYIVVDSKHKVKFNDNVTQLKAEVVSLSKGFAFVRPQEGGEDIFIPGRELNGAMVGDVVLVGSIEKDNKGYSGRIIRITKESPKRTTGTVAKTTYGYELVPDSKIRYNPTLTELGGAKVGDKVMAELIQDYRGDLTCAEVIKVFGSGESARVCADAIIEQHGIPTEFSEKALSEGAEIASKGVSAEDFKGRIDLRNEVVFTIDGADAKDLDDAISVKRIEDGYELGVHIADVSHYIKKGMSIDDEALGRGTSVYFADRVIPMLPRDISNGVCSLTSGTDKLSFSAFITFSKDGEIKKYKFAKTIINTSVRGVYTEINDVFDGTATSDILEKYEPIKADLELSRELADILKEKSVRRGTMEINSKESRFVLDENGVCVDIKPRSSGEAQELIEQFMISANVCAARFSIDRTIPFLYRVHQSPEPKKIRDLIEMLKALNIECKELYKEKITGKDFASILKRVENSKEATVVSERVLRSMEKARYSTEPTGHFGLSLKDYSHFTSPIRRYPDLTIHRVMSEAIKGTDGVHVEKKFRKFCELSAEQSSTFEIRAVQAERETEDVYMAEYMSKRIGEEYKGEVSGVLKSGVFVRLSNYVEGFVPIECFKNNNFVLDGMLSLKCTRTDRLITIGTELDVTVASAQVATGRVDFFVREN